jgi:hypothetical protein
MRPGDFAVKTPKERIRVLRIELQSLVVSILVSGHVLTGESVS